MGLREWAILFGCSAVVIPFVELVKMFERGRIRRGDAPPASARLAQD
jgi:hypothetical protein